MLDVTVPENVGAADKTTAPVPVLVVTPVPPLDTASVPEVIFAALVVSENADATKGTLFCSKMVEQYKSYETY